MFRNLPSVDTLLAAVPAELPHTELVALARVVLDEARQAVRGGHPAPVLATLAARLHEHVTAAIRPSLLPLINATGVIIHTNLGRVPLSRAALDAMMAVASGYSNLEYNLERGERGGRYSHVAQLATRLTGAEDAVVVNNNAAALLFMLSCLCAGREVIVSRSQAVEIGGGFRIPDVLAQSGARLVEVGTTNRTYAHDYERAITPQTAAILTVHRSNFRIIGFTHDPADAELRALAAQHKLLWLDDWGSGTLLQPAQFGLAREATIPERVSAGCDLVCFSGDKLLGGPQAGIIVGRGNLLAELRAHPLMRALRVDKLTLAALEATLIAYVRGTATTTLPVWAMISATADAVQSRAERIQGELATHGLATDVQRSTSAIGGGSLPGEELPSWAIALPGDAAVLQQRLRRATPPIIARIEHDRLLLDLRTVLPEQEAALVAGIVGVMDVEG